MTEILGFLWSRREELNLRPTDYESVALPLSYAGPPSGIIHFLARGIGRCQGVERFPPGVRDGAAAIWCCSVAVVQCCR